MDESIKDAARRAASLVEKSGHPGVRLQVEEALAAEQAGHLDLTIALATLIVSTATFAWRVAWDIYVEYRKRGQEEKNQTALRAAVEKAVKEELSSANIADQATRALLIKATTDAVLARLMEAQ